MSKVTPKACYWFLYTPEAIGTLYFPNFKVEISTEHLNEMFSVFN